MKSAFPYIRTRFPVMQDLFHELLHMINMSLFDINGDIGRSAVAETAFPSVSSLVEHMDYLGIERSLVTHVAGRESNPTLGNTKLRNLIESERAGERLFPVYTINPATRYENGAMEELVGAFESRTVKAVATFPALCRHPLSHLEPVLDEIARYRPALLWSVSENPNGEIDFRDLINLAARYPDMTFVCRKIMWPRLGDVLDAMERAVNIAADISWIHMRRNIELLVSRFGAGRLFFGTGSRTQYGAAIASLIHAGINDDERELIAHTNMERLLGAGPSNATVSGGREDKPLWEVLRSGKPVEAEIIDAHGHIGAMNRGWVLPQSDIPGSAEDTIGQMDRLGIGRIIVSSEEALFGDALEGNIAALQEMKPYRDRYSGYLVYNPRFADELIPEFDRLFADGYFVGFKFLPSYWQIPITDDRYLPAFEYADRHRLPILSHTWNGPYDTPALFDGIVGDYRDATILLGHAGGGTSGRIEAITLAKKHPNVFLEFCGSFTTDYPWTTTLQEVGFDRVVFGSDGGGAHDQAWELGRLLSQPIPDEKLLPVLAGNMKNILSKRK